MARKTPRKAVRKAIKKAAKRAGTRTLRQSLKRARAGTAAAVKGPKKRVAAEKEAAVRRISRWLAQSKVKKADAEKVLAAEAAVPF